MRTMLLEEALFLSIPVFGALAFGGVEPWARAVLFALILAVFLLCRRSSGDEPLAPGERRLLAALGVILTLAFLQGLNPIADARPAGLLPFTRSAHATRRALALWLAYAGFFWSAGCILRRPGALKRMLWAIFLLAVGIAMLGLLQLGQGNASYYGLRVVADGHNPFGPFVNRNHAADLLNFGFFSGAGILIAGLRRAQWQLDWGRLADVLARHAMLIFLLGIILWAIAACGSRGGLASLLCAGWVCAVLGACLALKGRARWMSLLALLGALVGALILVAGDPDSLGLVPGAGSRRDSNIFDRLSLLGKGKDMVMDFPVFGVGLGSFEAAFPAYQELQRTHISVWMTHDWRLARHVHSDWLELLIQTGIVGFVAWTAALSLLAARSLRFWARPGSHELRCWTAGVFAAILAFLAHGLMEFSVEIPSNALLFFASLAWLGAAEPTPTANPEGLWPAPRGRLRVFRWALPGLAVLAFLQGIRPAMADHFIRKAEAADEAAKPFYLSSAYRIDPVPLNAFRLGRQYLFLAQRHASARELLLRRALRHAEQAFREEPYNLRIQHLLSRVLLLLGRPSDAQGVVANRRVRPDRL